MPRSKIMPELHHHCKVDYFWQTVETRNGFIILKGYGLSAIVLSWISLTMLLAGIVDPSHALMVEMTQHEKFRLK